jgi:hypothetical protein
MSLMCMIVLLCLAGSTECEFGCTWVSPTNILAYDQFDMASSPLLRIDEIKSIRACHSHRLEQFHKPSYPLPNHPSNTYHVLFALDRKHVMSHHPVSRRRTTLHGTTASPTLSRCRARAYLRMPIPLPALFTDRRIMLRSLTSFDHPPNRGSQSSDRPTAQRTVLHSTSAGPQQHIPPLPLSAPARRTISMLIVCY